MKLGRSVRFISAALLLCCRCQSASGEVVFNNFGPNDSYDASPHLNGTTWVIDSPGSSLNYGFGTGVRFQVSGGSYWLDSVTLPLGNSYGGANNLAISIRADNNGSPTGTLLETIVTHPTGIPSSYVVVNYQSSLNPVLVGGDYYWLTLEPADLNVSNRGNNGVFDWGSSSMGGYAGYHEFDFVTDDWFNWRTHASPIVPAFRVEGTAVPEPGTIWLLVAGAGFVGLRGWRKAQRVRGAR